MNASITGSIVFVSALFSAGALRDAQVQSQVSRLRGWQVRSTMMADGRATPSRVQRKAWLRPDPAKLVMLMRHASSARSEVVVSLPQEIDIQNAACTAERLTTAVNRSSVVIVDMSATTFCDCAGARAVVRAYKRATDSGTELRLVVTANSVRRIFALMGVDRLLDIYPTVEAAQASCQAGNGEVLRPRSQAWAG